tara:strand:+ start:559 stop:963 length:405 start_codon:yes stop_codon:yes gene_type:complete
MKIIYQTETGIAIITPTGELSVEEVAAKDVPTGVQYRIVNDDEVPSDRTFRNAWKEEDGVKVDMPKAKTITHEARRVARSAEFAPLDIKSTIPSEAVAAEAARQAIRIKYADMQNSINAAVDTTELKAIMEQLA